MSMVQLRLSNQGDHKNNWIRLYHDPVKGTFRLEVETMEEGTIKIPLTERQLKSLADELYSLADDPLSYVFSKDQE